MLAMPVTHSEDEGDTATGVLIRQSENQLGVIAGDAGDASDAVCRSK